MNTIPNKPTLVKKRKSYTKEFKKHAVAKARHPDMNAARAAAELGIDPSLIHDWAKKLASEGGDAFRGHGVRTEVEAELHRLRTENARLREERDILKKATEFFVKEKS